MKKTVVSFLLAAVMGLSSPAGSMGIPEEEYNGTVEQEQNKEEDFQEPESEEPEIEIEEDTGEEMQDEMYPEEVPENSENFYPEDFDGENPHTEQQEVPEEFTGTILTPDNVDSLFGDTPEDEQLIREIEEGEIVGFAPASLTDIGETELISQEDASALLAPNRYKLISTSIIVNCDEVWTSNSPIHARLRYIEYVDSDGAVTRSPLYCMKASKMGIDGNVDLKPDAIKFFSNSTLRKILYFGYGGPGDICDSYDPSCSHVNWSKWQNRYVFTHQALSKVYANDVNGATEAQIKHVGLIRFIDKLKSLTIPNRSAVKLKSVNTSGNTVTANPLNIGMTLYRTKPSSGFGWLESTFKDGFQISPLCTVIDTGKAGNGLTISRGTNDTWQLAYWTSESAAKEKPDRPNCLAKGKSVKMKNGYCFKLVFPESSKGTKQFSWKMTLRPVKYIMVDGSVQTGQDIQDFGACVYQGDRGILKLNLSFQPSGSILLKKTSSQTGHPVANAVYSLYAGQNLYSGGIRIYAKDEKVAEGTTNEKGEIFFDSLVPGKYYVKEKTAAPGYLITVAASSCTVSSGKRVTVAVKDDPDIKGKVAVEKVADGTEIPLDGAEFTLFTWNKNSGTYENGKLLKYDEEQKKYVSDIFIYTEINQGKFKVEETKNPPGYTGRWSQELVLTEPGTDKTFTYRVTNQPLKEHIVEIRKLDSETGGLLKGAEFVIYEWNNEQKNYHKEGAALIYDEKREIYKSGILKITDSNQGKFRIEETKNPEGYQGEWSQEINLMQQDVQLQFSVKNEPIPKKYGTVHIRKKDAITGEKLEGAEFQAYAWNRNTGRYEEKAVLFNYEEKEQYYTCSELELTDENQGKFMIKETKSPQGYQGKWEKEIHLTEDGQILELEAKNEPVQLPAGQITIIKKILESEITWAHGNPTFSFVIEGTDLRGNKRKYEDCVVFMRDAYQVDGNGYALLEVTLSNIPLGTYQVYEKPVLRYYLKKAQANTSNVKIIKGKEPAYGVDPMDIAYGTIGLDKDHRKASITFYNRKKRYDGYSHNSLVENTLPVIKSQS